MGLATGSYSRLGTNATGRGLSAANDFLISGKLETDGAAFFDSTASVAGKFETAGNVEIGGDLLVNGFTTLGNASVAGNFEVGSNKFYVDQANGRVGINTQNLTEAFEVMGNASVSGTLKVTGATTLDSTLSVSSRADFSANVSVSGTLRAPALSRPLRLLVMPHSQFFLEVLIRYDLMRVVPALLI